MKNCNKISEINFFSPNETFGSIRQCVAQVSNTRTSNSISTFRKQNDVDQIHNNSDKSNRQCNSNLSFGNLKSNIDQHVYYCIEEINRIWASLVFGLHLSSSVLFVKCELELI